jgi:hypothetical protein
VERPRGTHLKSENLKSEIPNLNLESEIVFGCTRLNFFKDMPNDKCQMPGSAVKEVGAPLA